MQSGILRPGLAVLSDCQNRVLLVLETDKGICLTYTVDPWKMPMLAAKMDIEAADEPYGISSELTFSLN